MRPQLLGKLGKKRLIPYHGSIRNARPRKRVIFIMIDINKRCFSVAGFIILVDSKFANTYPIHSSPPPYSRIPRIPTTQSFCPAGCKPQPYSISRAALGALKDSLPKQLLPNSLTPLNLQSHKTSSSKLCSLYFYPQN